MEGGVGAGLAPSMCTPAGEWPFARLHTGPSSGGCAEFDGQRAPQAPYARRRLTPTITTTITGTSHQAWTPRAARRAVAARPAATAAATVQSSPTMKRYQKRPNATTQDSGGPISTVPG